MPLQTTRWWTPDPQDEISLNRAGGVTPWTKFAHMPDIDSADGEIMITADPTKRAGPEVLSSAETFSIAYDDVNDGAAGGATGALTLYVQYIDANGRQAVAVHTLGSSSPDTTSFSGLGINRIAVSSSGTADTNVGAVTVTSSSSGGFHAYVPAGEGVTQQALFHMPSNGIGVAKLLYLNINKLSGSSPLVTVKGIVHNRTVDTKFEVYRNVMDTAVENHVNLVEPINFRLSAADILYFVADTNQNNTVIGSLRFSLNVYETS